ncbi:hypothetical protein DL98DRAFT_523355 [Cadophora sp. DSE1049]|nr:hypothetical protein DL98DRAFT_523355 [Cadophora sp. DSE1049]
MLVDIPGQLIDWDDLRSWHYHPPGDKFDDDFDQPPPPASDDTDPRGRFCVCIYSSGGVF